MKLGTARTPWTCALATACALLAASASAGGFEGHWALADSRGQPFEIWLRADGSATGTHNDAMKSGTWSEQEGAAVIHWNTGWTTRIAKDADGYVKTAFKPGTTPADAPANRSPAKRLDP